MARKIENELFQMTHNFFLIYLPQQRNCSPHTIRAYQLAIDQLITYAAIKEKIHLWEVDFALIDSVMLSEYLDSIENNGSSIATRNQRLKGIRAFYTYAATMKPVLMNYRAEIYKIPFKKSSTELELDYLREDAMKALLSYPDLETEKGIRDSFLMIFMYDSAARVQEVVDVRVCDVRKGKTPTVTLHGKGNKIRTVPLMQNTMRHFQHYCNVFHSEGGEYSDAPLFYTIRNKNVQKMNESTIRKIIGKYGERLKSEFPEINGTVHPHLLRHSRAMHLYQHGMDLTLIAQWLGHANLETTLIYAHADTEQKRLAIERSTPEGSPLKSRLNAARYTVDDDDTLRKLYGLK